MVGARTTFNSTTSSNYIGLGSVYRIKSLKSVVSRQLESDKK